MAGLAGLGVVKYYEHDEKIAGLEGQVQVAQLKKDTQGRLHGLLAYLEEEDRRTRGELAGLRGAGDAARAKALEEYVKELAAGLERLRAGQADLEPISSLVLQRQTAWRKTARTAAMAWVRGHLARMRAGEDVRAPRTAVAGRQLPRPAAGNSPATRSAV